MMSCRRLKRRLSAYMDGELFGEDRRRIERHLAECAQCAQTMVEWRQVYEQLATPTLSIPPFFETRLKTRLTPENPPKKQLLSQLPAAAAVCCGLLVGVLLGVELNLALWPHPTAQSKLSRYVDAGFLDALPQGSLTDTFIKLTEPNE